MSGDFSIKVKSKQGPFVITDLNESSTLAELAIRIVQQTGVAKERIGLLTGYPPQPLDLSSSMQRTLRECGIVKGDTINVNEKPEVIENARSANIEGDAELAERLQAEEHSRVMNADTNAHADMTAALPGMLVAKRIEAQKNLTSGGYNGFLMRQVVPSDNSCLFSSIRYVINGVIDNEGSELLRHTIAMAVAADPDEYNTAFLEKTNEAYCLWIQKPESWGGAIEVAILSRHYGIEIDVIDIETALIRKFGEDQNYRHRAFLLYDGIHYDPVYMDMMDNRGPITLFPVAEESVYTKALELGKEAQSSRQFTNVLNFTLRCNDCNIRLRGQEEAQKHAGKTGHVNFGEV